LAQVQESRVYSGRQIPEPGDKERRPGILHVPDPIMRRPNMVAYGEDKSMLRTCQRKTEGRILQVVRRDRVTKVEVRRRTNTKDIVAAAHSSSGNGEAMWQEWASAGGQKLHHCGTYE
jgi:hypothetical protein